MNRSFALALLAGLSTSALAYETHDFPWNTQHKTFRVLTGMPQDFRDVLDEVEDQFNLNPTTHTITVQMDNENGWGLPNSENEIGWITNMSSVCPTAGGGCAKLWINFDPFDIYIVEADLVFDAYQDWTTTKDKATHWNYGGSGRPFLCTALHEMGHAMGLHHENDRYNIMGSDWNVVATNDQTFQCEIGADAMAGIAAMYGVQYSRTDFGLSHFRFTGAGGNNNAYSQHARNRMVTPITFAGITSWTEMSKGANGAYNVPAGNTAYVEVTLQNAGTLPAVIPVTVMLSDNALISHLDNQLQTNFFSLPAGGVTTTRIPVVIPSSYVRSTPWYIGAVADVTGMFSESRESNNRVYIDRINVQ